ncbi:MAG: exopolysaccharide biosynthesis polyprenyl glycosylphosphotransferase [Patescibacteria group bacterium]
MLIQTKQKILLLGDILFLYLSLWLALLIRYGGIDERVLTIHLKPFSIIFILWLIIFYIIGLYDIKNLKNSYQLIEKVVIGILIGSTMAIIIFYLVPQFEIAPKTNLVLFSGVYLILVTGWRLLFNYTTAKPLSRALIIGQGKEIEELINFFGQHPQLGYHLCQHWSEEQAASKNISELVKLDKINTIIVPKTFGQRDELFKKIYATLILGVEVIDITTAYENILRKVPLSEIQQIWLLTNLTKSHRIYEVIKRPLEFLISLALLVLLSPLIVLIWLLVRITSHGPGFYRQIRISKNEQQFTMYKFRTMINDAEISGYQWSPKQDPRVTPLGKILRTTHIDELPQLINIIKGNLSFVGPRPERPEFIDQLKKEIPYYDTRHLVKPGLTGWAQINYRYASSIKDAYEKLQYDIFYLKNRSITLDVLILIKTINSFFNNPV